MKFISLLIVIITFSNFAHGAELVHSSYTSDHLTSNTFEPFDTLIHNYNISLNGFSNTQATLNSVTISGEIFYNYDITGQVTDPTIPDGAYGNSSINAESTLNINGTAYNIFTSGHNYPFYIFQPDANMLLTAGDIFSITFTGQDVDFFKSSGTVDISSHTVGEYLAYNMPGTQSFSSNSSVFVDLTYEYDYTPIPEPNVFMLLIIGLIGTKCFYRYKKAP